MHSRREFLATAAAAGVACLAGEVFAQQPQRRDVSWLAEIQQKPEKLPADAKSFPSLLADDAGAPIKTTEAWVKRREELKSWWTDFLGKMPAQRDPAKPPQLNILA